MSTRSHSHDQMSLERPCCVYTTSCGLLSAWALTWKQHLFLHAPCCLLRYFSSFSSFDSSCLHAVLMCFILISVALLLSERYTVGKFTQQKLWEAASVCKSSLGTQRCVQRRTVHVWTENFAEGKYEWDTAFFNPSNPLQLVITGTVMPLRKYASIFKTEYHFDLTISELILGNSWESISSSQAKITFEPPYLIELAQGWPRHCSPDRALLCYQERHAGAALQICNYQALTLHLLCHLLAIRKSDNNEKNGISCPVTEYAKISTYLYLNPEVRKQGEDRGSYRTSQDLTGSQQIGVDNFISGASLWEATFSALNDNDDNK